MDWRQQASCKQHDPEIWFPESGYPGAQSTRNAKKICGTCPIATSCLEYAVQNKVTDGIWGGLSPKERLKIYKTSSPKKPPQPCGTRGAYQRHHRNGEDPCEACKQAARDYENHKYATSPEYRADRKQRRKERTWQNKCRNVSPLFDV